MGDWRRWYRRSSSSSQRHLIAPSLDHTVSVKGSQSQLDAAPEDAGLRRSASISGLDRLVELPSRRCAHPGEQSCDIHAVGLRQGRSPPSQAQGDLPHLIEPQAHVDVDEGLVALAIREPLIDQHLTSGDDLVIGLVELGECVHTTVLVRTLGPVGIPTAPLADLRLVTSRRGGRVDLTRRRSVAGAPGACGWTPIASNQRRR